MTPVTVHPGQGPIILAQPHSGTDIPPEIERDLNDLGRERRDTDWHIPTLYEGLLPGATLIRANFHRYVIDANRDPEGHSLYPGQNTTGLVPLITFDNAPIWHREPSKAEIAERLAAFHAPYHAEIRKAMDRARAEHGFAILYDCHSIRSTIPHLFDGPLPDLNIGTNDGASCASAISAAVMNVCKNQSTYSHVLNGRFKGGWTTRHYGAPEDGFHTIQMELTQQNYLQAEAPPFTYDASRGDRLRAVLRDILKAIQAINENDLGKETYSGQTS